MSEPVIPVCAFCGERLVPRAEPRGRRRVFCSDACRYRAFRARRRGIAALEGLTPAAPDWPIADPTPPPPAAPAANTDDQVARAILELTWMAAAFARLGVEARTPLAWRCETMAERLRDAIADLFPL